MRKLLAATAALLLVSTAAAHSGHDHLAEPGDLPGSTMYGLDIAMEKVSLALTFSKKGKAKKRLKFAKERLAESLELAERNRTELAERTVRDYASQMERVRQLESQLPEDRDDEIMEKINETEDVRKAALQGVLQKVPAEARSGIMKAMGVAKPPGISPGGGEETDRPDTGGAVTGYAATGEILVE